MNYGCEPPSVQSYAKRFDRGLYPCMETLRIHHRRQFHHLATIGKQLQYKFSFKLSHPQPWRQHKAMAWVQLKIQSQSNLADKRSRILF